MTSVLEQNPKLMRFVIIPRETVRASLKVLSHAERRLKLSRVEPIDFSRALDLAHDLLQDANYEWPLSVPADSFLDEQFHELLCLAAAKLLELNNEDLSRNLSRYLIRFSDFYATDVLINPLQRSDEDDVIEIRHPRITTTIQNEHGLGNHGAVTKYVDHDLESPACKDIFDKIMVAARFKSAFYPHPMIRQTSWYKDRRAASVDIPEGLQDVLFTACEGNSSSKV